MVINKMFSTICYLIEVLLQQFLDLLSGRLINKHSDVVGVTEYSNLVVITADSIRSDYCGFSSRGDSDTTPFLSEFPGDHIVFEDAVSPGPRTPSSIPTIFTGQPYIPSRQKDESWDNRIGRIAGHIGRYPTIAERLKRRGYSTAAVTTNPWTTPDTNFDSGFDYFVEAGTFDRTFDYLPDAVSEPLEYLHQWQNKTGWFTQWTGYTDEIKRVINALEEPYFLWIFSLDTHNPYIVPKSVRTETNALKMYYSILRANNTLTKGSGESHLQNNLPSSTENWLKATYRDSIRSVDQLTEWLWNELQRTDPIMVFHSDHGEAFGEHGAYGHRPMLYEENISVPFFIGNTNQTSCIHQQVSLRHLPSIIESILFKEDPNLTQFTGGPEYLFTETGRSKAVRNGKWKLVWNSDELELYNLEKDPSEQSNVVKNYPDKTEKYHDMMGRIQKSIVKKEQTTKGVQRIVMEELFNPNTQEI